MKFRQKIVAVLIALSLMCPPPITAYADETVTFDISKGSVNITSSSYSGYSSSGTHLNGSSSGMQFVLTGTTTANTVTVSGTQIITLDGVSIDVSATGDFYASTAGKAAFLIESDNTGDITVILADDTENTLRSGYKCAGLQKNGGALTGTLTIQGETNGTGKLTVKGWGGGAGIGGGKGGFGSNITISGSNVTAAGGGWGAGIGGGEDGDGSDITINGGTVTATGGNMGAGIGGGSNRSGSNIIISGGTVIANGGNGGAGIGGGNCGSGSDITISGGTVTATAGKSGAGIGGGSAGSASNITIDGGNVTATSSDDGAGIGCGRDSSNRGVSVSNITITGGTITATGGRGGAGIGGGNYTLNGSGILITGGTINAYGGENGAGIGAGGGGNGNPDLKGGFSNIRITGGTILAKGGIWRDRGAAGIGGSYMGKHVSGISIEGGIVTAIGGTNAAGIGGGDQGSASNVIVSGGSLRALGSPNTIGGGANGNGAVTPTNGLDYVYCLPVSNSNGTSVLIDGVSYVPIDHTALDSSDTNLYAYLTAGPHTVQASSVTETYTYSTDISAWYTTPKSTQIEYNQPLSGSVITAKVFDETGSSVSGSWSWQSPTIKSSSLGTHTYTAVFTTS